MLRLVIVAVWRSLTDTQLRKTLPATATPHFLAHVSFQLWVIACEAGKLVWTMVFPHEQNRQSGWWVPAAQSRSEDLHTPQNNNAINAM